LFVKANKISDAEMADDNEGIFPDDTGVLKPFDGEEARMYSLD
jgi:hypothetical protein